VIFFCFQRTPQFFAHNNNNKTKNPTFQFGMAAVVESDSDRALRESAQSLVDVVMNVIKVIRTGYPSSETTTTQAGPQRSGRTRASRNHTIAQRLGFSNKRPASFMVSLTSKLSKDFFVNNKELAEFCQSKGMVSPNSKPVKAQLKFDFGQQMMRTLMETSCNRDPHGDRKTFGEYLSETKEKIKAAFDEDDSLDYETFMEMPMPNASVFIRKEGEWAAHDKAIDIVIDNFQHMMFEMMSDTCESSYQEGSSLIEEALGDSNVDFISLISTSLAKFFDVVSEETAVSPEEHLKMYYISVRVANMFISPAKYGKTLSTYVPAEPAEPPAEPAEPAAPSAPSKKRSRPTDDDDDDDEDADPKSVVTGSSSAAAAAAAAAAGFPGGAAAAAAAGFPGGASEPDGPSAKKQRAGVIVNNF